VADLTGNPSGQIKLKRKDKIMQRTGIIVFGILLLIVRFSSAQENISFEEKRLLKAPPANVAGDVIFAPDGRSVAYVQIDYERGGQMLVVGDHKGESFDGIKDICFTPNGQTVVYKAWKAGKYYRVVGANKGEAYDFIDYESSPAFSKNGKGIAYIGGNRWEKQVVFNGKPGEYFNNVENLCVSADGTTAAYHAFSRKDINDVGAHFVVVNDKKNGPYYRVKGPVFGPDGKTLAYAAQEIKDNESAWFAVVNETRGEKFDDVSEPAFTAGGQVVYVAKKGKTFFIVIGEQKIEQPQMTSAVFANFQVFSPDGKTVVYMVSTENGWRLVVGGKQGAEYATIHRPQFSPDGSVLAYVAYNKGKKYLVVNDQAGEPFYEINKPVFSPKGNKLAYRAFKGSASSMPIVVAGEKRYEYTDEHIVIDEVPVWSPDGSMVAFRTASMGKRYVVAGDKKSEGYDGDDVVSPIVFSPDSTKVAYGARKSYEDSQTSQYISEYWWKVMKVK
jgi:Tol biopolymer transport system component